MVNTFEYIKSMQKTILREIENDYPRLSEEEKQQFMAPLFYMSKMIADEIDNGNIKVENIMESTLPETEKYYGNLEKTDDGIELVVRDKDGNIVEDEEEEKDE